VGRERRTEEEKENVDDSAWRHGTPRGSADGLHASAGLRDEYLALHHEHSAFSVPAIAD
jgi:hypothetical protein